MAISKKVLKNNKKLANNISLLSGQFAGKRALVLRDKVDGLEDINLKDFYHIVVLENDDALQTVSEPDVLIYSDESPYRDGLLFLPTLFPLTSTLFVSNFEAMRILSKIRVDLPVLNVTFIPVDGEPSVSPHTARKSFAGLSNSAPGVHLALIMGCTEVHYSGTSTASTSVSKDDIISFIDQQDRYAPRNLVGINRKTIVSDFF